MKNYALSLSAMLWVATLCSSNAATFTFTRTDSFSLVGGSFEARDQNADGRIVGSEVTSYSAWYGYFSGGPSQFGFAVNSRFPGADAAFFDLDFDYVTNTLFALSYGYSRQFDCWSFPDGEVIENGRTAAESFSFMGTTGTYSHFGLYTGQNAPEYCDAYEIFTEYSFPEEMVIGVTSDGGPTAVPLPAGLALLASGLGLVAILGRRRNCINGHPDRYATA